jgi:MFS family permease
MLVAVGFQGFAFWGLFASLFNLYLLRLGYGPPFVGLVLGCGGLAWALAGLPGGSLARRFGLRFPMVGGMALLAVGLTLSSLSGLVPPAGRRGWILTTYVLTNLGGGLSNVSIAPALMTFSDDEARDHLFSARFTLLALAGFAGSLVGGWLPGRLATLSGTSLQDPAPYRQALVVGSLLCYPAVWAMGAIREPASTTATPTTRHARRQRPPYGVLLPLCMVTLLRILGEFGVRNFFNVYMDAGLDASTAQIGTWMGSAQLLAGVAALSAPLLAARWGREPTLTGAALGAGLSILPMALISHQGVAGLGFVSMTVLASIARTTITVYGQRLVSVTWRPVLAGAVSMVAGLGSALMSLAGGTVITNLGYRAFFLANATAVIAGAALFWGWFGNRADGPDGR